MIKRHGLIIIAAQSHAIGCRHHCCQISGHSRRLERCGGVRHGAKKQVIVCVSADLGYLLTQESMPEAGPVENEVVRREPIVMTGGMGRICRVRMMRRRSGAAWPKGIVNLPQRMSVTLAFRRAGFGSRHSLAFCRQERIWNG